MKKIILLTISFLLIVSGSHTSVKTWIGGSGTGGQIYQWNRASNWNPNGVPTASDSVVIPVTSNNPVNMNTTGICGALTITGGSLYLSGNLSINSGSGYGGHLTIAAGTFTATGFTTSIQGNVRNSGTLVVGTGTINVNGNVTIDSLITYDTGGRMNVSGTLTRNNLTSTGVQVLFSANNYIDITTSGITAITIRAFQNTAPPVTSPTYDSTKAVRLRYYTISGVSGTGAAFVRLDYLLAEKGTGLNPINGSIWQYPAGGNAWINQGYTLSGQYFATSGAPISASNLAGNYAIADAASVLPVQLASFVGNFISNNQAQLDWSTVSEINNFGFYVQKYNGTDYITIEESFQPGAGYTLEPHYYTWTDESVTENQIQYRLKQVDNDGLVNYHGPITVTKDPTGVKNEVIQSVFKLEQNYPNPFNPSTVINYQLAVSGYTTLKVYNVLGKEVATLFSGNAEAGRLYNVKFDASNLSAGVYVYKLQSGNNVEVRKLTLIK